MALGYQPPASDFEEIPLPRMPVRPPEDTEFPDQQPPTAPEDEGDLDYQNRVRSMIDDAREFNAEVLAPIREKGIRLYLGIDPAPDSDESEGSSTIVATEVRDTVLQMIPSLMRLFSGQDNVTNFIPNNASGSDAAEQASDYLRYVFFYDNPGYSILQDVFKDGLIKAMGVAQWWTDENRETVEEEYHRLSMEQRQFVISQAGVEIVKMDSVPQQMPDGSTQPLFNMVIRRTKRQPKHCVAAVPPDEFRISRTAVSIRTAALVGREYFETKTALKLKGVPDDLIEEAQDFSGGDMRFAAERMFRNQGLDSPVGRDASEPMCKYGEYWMRIDKDGDGLAELRHICVIGDNDDIVLDEPATRAKMAVACPDPEPHTIVGHGYAELVSDLQIIRTNLMRGALDSLAQAIYPRMVGVDALVDWDDVLNTAIGAPIRVKEINALTQLQYQFVGQPAFDMMDRLDAMRMARTGITPQSQGLDPKALQSTTMKGVDMIITGAQERIELVCRTMASTFMVDLMSGLLQEVTDNPVPERVVQLRGKYVPVNPSQFDATMTCVPNPAIGHGSDVDRFAMLTMIMQKQEMIIQSQGPGNPLVTPIEWRNTVEDIMAIAGMRNSARYFKPLDEKGLAAWMEQQQNKEDANLIFAKAEADKVRAQVIKTLTDARISAEEMTLKDDSTRDKFEGDQMLEAAKIDAQYGQQVDKAMIQGLWSAVRQPPEGSPSEGGHSAPQGPGAEPSTAPPPGLPKPEGALTVGQGVPGGPPGGMPSGLLDGGPPAPNPAGALPGG